MNDLLEDPRYFECEKNHAKIRLLQCIGRQKANREFKGFGKRPYGECLDCSQGESNSKFEALLLKDPKPRRGKGERNLDCECYDKCLSLVCLKNWQSWNCNTCSAYLEVKEGMDTESASKGPGRICEECHEKETISPKHSLCARCIGKRGNANRKPGRKTRKDKAVKRRETGEGQRPRKSEIVPLRGDLELCVSFEEHPEILTRIKELSKQELRPVDLQVIYLLRGVLK